MVCDKLAFYFILITGSIISRQNLNENLETLHLAPTLFYHLPGFFYLKTDFLNPHPLSLSLGNYTTTN